MGRALNRMARRLFIPGTFLILMVTGLLPLLAMILKSLIIGGHVSLQTYLGVLNSRHQWLLIEHSLTLAFLVTFLALILGTPLGLLLGKTDLPMARVLAGVFTIPLLLPPYILAVSWADLLASRGPLKGMISPSILPFLSHHLFGLPGCVLVLTSAFLPIPMLLTMAFLPTVNPSLEEAGRLVAGWGKVLKGITLPLIAPSLAFSAMLVFLLALGEFSVPNFLRYPVFSVESFTQFAAFHDFRTATAAATPMILVALLMSGEYLFWRGKSHPGPLQGRDRLIISLGKTRNWTMVITIVGALITVILPLTALIIQSSSLQTYFMALEKAGDSLARSLLYASLGACLLTILGFFTGYTIHRKAMDLWPLEDFLTLLLLALPGTVIGMGLISIWNTPWTSVIYTTPLIILMGYLAKYSALTSRITVAQLDQIPPSMEEAAQMSGAGWFRRVALIVIPLARRGLLAAWLVGYIFSLRDTAVTMLVYPPGCDTLPVRIFTLMANGSPRLIAALCVIMIGVTLLPGILLWTMTAKGRET